MLTTVEGVFQDGIVKLKEEPPSDLAGSSVLVTFLPHGGVDLREQGINPEEAAELRARLSAFAEDWNSPEMDAYDNYHAAKSKR
jgi:hypothetical protein